jgi:TolC family type I secretion outer membrane protein
MKKFSYIVLLIVLSFSAVEAVTMQQALINTYNTSPEFREKQEAVKAEHEKIVQALAGWRPTVNISGNMSLGKQINSGNAKDSLVTGTPSNQSNNIKDATIEARQNLYTGGGTLAQTRNAENSIRAAWSGLHSAEQGILMNAIQAFLELISKYIQLDLYKANKEALFKNLQDAQEKQRVGEETLTQEANAQARYAEADANLQKAEAELESAKATYEKVTGLKAPFEMAKPVAFQILPRSLEEALEIAETENPDVIASQFDHLAANADAERIGSNLLPTVDLVGSSTRRETRSISNYDFTTDNTSFRNTDTKDYLTDNRVMLQAKVPLYEAGSIRSQRRQSLKSATQKRVAIETKKRQIQEAVRQIWRNYQAAKNNIKNYQKQVEAAQISLDGTTQEMYVGSKVLLDVLNARAELLKAQLALVEATKTYCLESYRLLSIIGRLTARYLKLEVDYFDPQSHYHKVRAYF